MTTTATATPTILAIDRGRYKSCHYDPATRAADFRTLDTGRAD